MARLFTTESWIGRTAQRWKAVTFLLLAFADLCLFVLLIWRINHRAISSALIPDEVTLSLSFVGLGALTFAWLWFSIRCSDCKKSVASHILKHSPASNWFTTLLTLSECPHCGSSGGSRPHR